MTRPIESIDVPVFEPVPPNTFNRQKASYEDMALAILRCLGAAFLLIQVGTAIGFTALPLLPFSPLVGVGLLVLGYWDEIFSRMPDKLTTIAFYIKSLVTDLFLVLPFGLGYMFNLERCEPKIAKEGETPILFIHGFCGHSSNWGPLYRKLKKSGYHNMYFVNLGHPFKTMDDYLEIVRKKVLEIKERTGQNELSIVGHSMGTVLTREYIRKYSREDKTEIKKHIAIAGPLEGTLISNVASKIIPAPVLEDMSYKSPFITEPVDPALLENIDSLFLGARHDCLVYPHESFINKNAPKKRAVAYSGVGHLRILAYTPALDEAVAFLKPEDAPPV